MALDLVLQRLRQLKAADQSALAVYIDLQAKVEEKMVLELLNRLVRDETKHVAMEKEIFSHLQQEGQEA